MELRAGVIHERDASICPPGSWPAVALERPAWRHDYARQRRRFDLHALVVTRWNARVMAAPPGQTFRMHEFSSYLLNVHDQLADLHRAVGEAGLAEIERTWGELPGDATLAEAVYLRNDAAPWLHYLAQARTIVEAFYPDLPVDDTLPWLLRDEPPVLLADE
jgi:hypothetical protein